MKAYLVIIENAHQLLSYREMYRVFTDKNKALELAKKAGYRSVIPLIDEVGTMSTYRAGDIHVSILTIEIESPPCRALVEDDDEVLKDYPAEKLWDADPKCKHRVIGAPGGGVKCTKCNGWFCY